MGLTQSFYLNSSPKRRNMYVPTRLTPAIRSHGEYFQGVKALVSVGGWTGSRWFSSNVASAENRTQFVKTLTDFARQYKLDGLDFE